MSRSVIGWMRRRDSTEIIPCGACSACSAPCKVPAVHIWFAFGISQPVGVDV